MNYYKLLHKETTLATKTWHLTNQGLEHPKTKIIILNEKSNIPPFDGPIPITLKTGPHWYNLQHRINEYHEKTENTTQTITATTNNPHTILTIWTTITTALAIIITQFTTTLTTATLILAIATITITTLYLTKLLKPTK